MPYFCRSVRETNDRKPIMENTTYTLCVVGTKYHLKEGELGRWLASVVGSTVSVAAEDDNPSDPLAVAAVTWIADEPRKVGYVRRKDRILARRLLKACGSEFLPMTVTKRCGDGTSIVIEAGGIEPVPEDAVMVAPKWEEWESPVPPMAVPKAIGKEIFAAAEVESLLARGADADAETLRKRLKVYIKYSAVDLSLETRQQNQKFINALAGRADADRWKDERSLLRCQAGRMGTETGGGLWEKWMRVIERPDFSNVLRRDKMPAKAEVAEALYRFPMDLWGAWINNRGKFVSRLYYACIPRKVLWLFVSTLAYYNVLTSTAAPNIVLAPWADQSKLMPDSVLGGLYKGMSWLKEHENEIPQSVLDKMQREIEGRIEARRQEETRKQLAGGTNIFTGNIGTLGIGDVKIDKQ